MGEASLMNGLEDLAISKALPLEEALRYATSLAEVLREMHRSGAVCGCLDPNHIVWDKDNVRLEQNDARGMSPYRAPEQVRGEAADARSDIFAFGAILYELLSGHKAFPAHDSEELKRQILEWSPPPLTGLPAGIVSLVGSCLEKNRELRMQRMNSILIELKLAGASARQASSQSEWREKVVSLRSQVAVHDERLAGQQTAHESLVAELRQTIARLEEKVDNQGTEIARIHEVISAVLQSIAGLQQGAQSQGKSIEGLQVAASQTDEVVEHIVEAFGMMHKSMVERGEAKVLLGARNGA